MNTSQFTSALQPVLVACGALVAIATAERLAACQRIAQPQRIGTAATLGLTGVFFGERFLLFARAWRTFIAHPLWMLGLITVRDPRFFYGGAALALAIVTLYLLSARLPLRRAANAMLPAALLLLAFVHAGAPFAGAEPGWATAAQWGAAHALYGMPLFSRFVPIAAMRSAGYAALALAGTIAVRQGREAVGLLLLLSGILTVLAGQLALQRPGQLMVLGVFTWQQAAGVCCAVAGAALLTRNMR